MKKVTIVGTDISPKQWSNLILELNLIRKQWKPYADFEIQGPGVKKTINHGIGLAAIQVGYQLRMFVMDCSRSGDNSKVFINPEIVEKSSETLRDSEGCLSAPGKTGDVSRHLRIILKYQDASGKEERKTFYNLEARCIQHEMDHLEGKLCIDYEKGNYSRDRHKSQTMVESDFRTKSDT